MEQLQQAAFWVIPILFAITVHEVAHGWVASKLGDPTAQMLGRLTLNPIKHIDPIGTILVPGILFFTSGFIFGWAKPVPVTYQNLKRPKTDMILVAIAGPLSNLLMAIIWGLFLKLGVVLADQYETFARGMIYMGQAGIMINLVLMVLNLLPLPPLDGGRVLMGLLPGRITYYLSRIEPLGFMILVLLLFTGILVHIIAPPIYFLRDLILMLLGL